MTPTPGRTEVNWSHASHLPVRRGRRPRDRCPRPEDRACDRRAGAGDPRLRVRQRPAPVPLLPRPTRPPRSGTSSSAWWRRSARGESTVAPGDFVIAPFAVSCGVLRVLPGGAADLVRQRRVLERRGLGTGGGRPKRCGSRSPTAPWSPSLASPTSTDESLLASLLTLSDVYGTGWHAAVRGGVTAGQHRHRDRRRSRRPARRAVGQAARRRAHRADGPPPSSAPTSAASSAPPTSSPSEAPTGSTGSGTSPTAAAPSSSRRSVTCPPTSRPSASSGPAASSAASASLSTRTRPSASAASSAPTSPSPAAPPRSARTSSSLLPAVLDGSVQPGRVFDRTVGLDDTPTAYAAMDAREALKVVVAAMTHQLAS